MGGIKKEDIAAQDLTKKKDQAEDSTLVWLADTDSNVATLVGHLAPKFVQHVFVFFSETQHVKAIFRLHTPPTAYIYIKCMRSRGTGGQGSRRKEVPRRL